MKRIIQHEKIGEVLYDENILTGSANVCINGIMLKKVARRTYLLPTGNQAIVSGNFLTGLRLDIDGEVVQISNKPTWYEITVACVLALFTIIWGNSVTLCSILPVVGGAIGGGIVGAVVACGLAISSTREKLWQKLLCSALSGILAFLICMLIGFAFV